MGVWAIYPLTGLRPLDLLRPNSEYRISIHRPLLNIPVQWIWQCPVHHGKLKPHNHLISHDQVLSLCSISEAPFQLVRISLLQEAQPFSTTLGSFVATSHKLHSNIVNLIPHWLFWVLWPKSQGACTIAWPCCRLWWVMAGLLGVWMASRNTPTDLDTDSPSNGGPGFVVLTQYENI